MSDSPRPDLRKQIPVLASLPPLNWIYWLILISACSLGETGADLLSHGLTWGYVKSSALLLTIFLAAMVLEFRGVGHKLARYWFAIIATATVGTTLADLTSRTLQLGYTKSSLLMIGLFAAVFLTWRRKKGAEQSTMSELHYWAAILVISVMGTTLGDFLSNDTPLGFGYSSLILLAALGALLVWLYRGNKFKEPTYWLAVITTSTFGAASGDYLTKEEGLKMGPFSGTYLLEGLLIVVFAVTGALQRRVGAQAA